MTTGPEPVRATGKELLAAMGRWVDTVRKASIERLQAECEHKDGFLPGGICLGCSRQVFSTVVIGLDTLEHWRRENSDGP